jgi:hypothetical protein
MYLSAIRYRHPQLGEVWLAPNSMAKQLYDERRTKDLDAHLTAVWKRDAELQGLAQPDSKA